MPAITIVDSADASGNTSFSLSLSGDVGKLKVDTLVAFVKNSMRTSDDSALVLACHGRRLVAGHRCGEFGVGDGSVVTMATSEASISSTAPRAVETLEMPDMSGEGSPSAVNWTPRRVSSPPPVLSPIPQFPTPGLRPAVEIQAAAASPSPTRETSASSPASQRLAARLASVTIDSPSDRSPSERAGTPGGTLPPPRLSRRASMKSEALSHVARGSQSYNAIVAPSDASTPFVTAAAVPHTDSDPLSESTAATAPHANDYRNTDEAGSQVRTGTPSNTSMPSPPRGEGTEFSEVRSPTPGSAPPARLPRRASMRMANPAIVQVGVVCQDAPLVLAAEALPVPPDANGGDSVEARASPATPRRSSTPGSNASPPVQLSRRASMRMAERPAVAMAALTPPSTPSERPASSERPQTISPVVGSAPLHVDHDPRSTNATVANDASPSLQPASHGADGGADDAADGVGVVARAEAMMRDEVARWGAEAESAALATTTQQLASPPHSLTESPLPRLGQLSTPRLRPSEETDGNAPPTASPSSLPPARLSRRASIRMDGGAAAAVRQAADTQPSVQNDSRLSTVSAVLDASGTMGDSASDFVGSSDAPDATAAVGTSTADTGTPPRTPTPGRGPPPQLSRRASMKMTGTPVAPVGDRIAPVSSGGEAEMATASHTIESKPVASTGVGSRELRSVDVVDARAGDTSTRTDEGAEVMRTDNATRTGIPESLLPPPVQALLREDNAPLSIGSGAQLRAGGERVNALQAPVPPPPAPKEPSPHSVTRTLTLSPPRVSGTFEVMVSPQQPTQQGGELNAPLPNNAEIAARGAVGGRPSTSANPTKRTTTSNRSATAALLVGRHHPPQAAVTTAASTSRPRSTSSSVAAVKRPSPSPSAVHRGRTGMEGTASAAGVSAAAERFRALTAQRVAAAVGKTATTVPQQRGRTTSTSAPSRSPARTKASGLAQLKAARLRLAKLNKIEAQYDELRETRLQRIVLQTDVQALKSDGGLSSSEAIASRLRGAQAHVTTLEEDIRHTTRLLRKTQEGDALLLHSMHRLVNLIDGIAAPLAEHEAAQDDWCPDTLRPHRRAVLPYRLLDALHRTTYSDMCAESSAWEDHRDMLEAYGAACRLERSIYTALHDRVEAECLFHVSQSHTYLEQHAEHQRALDALQVERRHIVSAVRNASIVLRRKGKDIKSANMEEDAGDVDGPRESTSDGEEPVALTMTSVPTPTPLNQDDLIAVCAAVAELRQECSQLEATQQAHRASFIERRRVLALELQQAQHAAKLVKQEVTKRDKLFALLEDRVHGMDPNEEALPDLLEQQFAENDSGEATRSGPQDDNSASSAYVPAFRRHMPRTYISSGRSVDATTGPTVASIARDEALLEDRSARLNRR